MAAPKHAAARQAVPRLPSGRGAPEALAQPRNDSSPACRLPPSAVVRASTMAVASPTPSTPQNSCAACSSGVAAALSSFSPCSMVQGQR